MDDLRRPPIGDQLTHRELEIMRLIADGKSNQAIAEQLFITLGTVKWYLKHIYSKIGVSSRTQAIAAAHAAGLLDGTETSMKIEPFSTPPHNLPHQPTPFITASPPKRDNLPAQTTSFVGREAEMAELARLIADPATRLVTILGAGGMGKTRLSIEAANVRRSHFADGAYFVSLAPLSDPETIIAAIAEAARFSFSGEVAPRQQLLDFLRAKHLLLILDNFEHLLAGVGLVSDILQTASDVKILSTSRERLNVEGETIFRLDGMDFPDWETPEDAAEYSAVELFMQSACRAEPTFALDTNNLKYVARICRLVQGMPLGILLAAAWVEALTLAEIAQEIEKSLSFLESDRRDLPARQRSLRATFDYSWNLLSSAERDVFKRLSVFRGGFAREAAQEVAGASLATLKTLVNKSLLRRNPSTGRYDLHELLRQFGEEQLDGSPSDSHHIHDLHCEFLADYMHQQWIAIMNLGQRIAFNEIRVEFNNVITAWNHAVEKQKVTVLSRMAFSLWYFIDFQFFPGSAELYKRAADALQTGIMDEDTEIVVGHLLALYGGIINDKVTIQYGTNILRKYDCPEALVCALDILANRCAYQWREFNESIALAQEGLQIAQTNYLQWPIGHYFFLIGYCLWSQGNLEQARQAGLEAWRACSAIGDLYHMAANAAFVLGPVATDLRNYAEAELQLTRGLQWFSELVEEVESSWHIAFTAFHFGRMALLTEHYSKAKYWLQKTIVFHQKAGNKHERLYYEALCEVSRVLMAQGQPMNAVKLLSAIQRQMPIQHSFNTDSYQYVDGVITMLLGNLQSTLVAEVYVAAVTHGQKLDLDTFVAEILDEPPLFASDVH